jgi:hypothetical protein
VKVEDEILKMLEDVTNRPIFSDIAKVVIMNFGLETIDNFGLRMSEQQFEEFRNRLESKGFIEVKLKPGDFASLVLEGILKRLGFLAISDNRRRGLIYQYKDGKKTVIITYSIDDAVTIYRITYIEVS